MTAVIFGWSVLGQSLSPAQIAGMAIVLGSVWLSQRAQQAAPATVAMAAKPQEA